MSKYNQIKKQDILIGLEQLENKLIFTVQDMGARLSPKDRAEAITHLDLVKETINFIEWMEGGTQ